MTSIAPLVAALGSVRKAIQLYPPTHPTHQQAVLALVTAVAEVTAAGPFTLNVHEGRLYAGSDVITEDVPGLRPLAESLEARRVESMVFEQEFSASDAGALAEILNLRPSPDMLVGEELEKRGVTGVRVTALADDDEDQKLEKDRQRTEDRAAYRRLVGSVRSMAARAQSGGDLDLSAAAPMVQTILSRLLEDEAAVLGLATLADENESELFHAVNVMIYSLEIGLSMGIPEEQLEIIGLGALLHDIGKVAFDLTLPDQAKAAAALHPRLGAELLSRVGEEQTLMLIAYEHHMAPDGTGLPDREVDYVPHPYSRIVAVADRYDRLTKDGMGEGPLKPDRAIQQLLREAGSKLDAFYVRLFAKALGVFPLGCLVRLTDHSVGVVSGRGSSPLTPRVRLLFDSSGFGLDEPEDVDLAEDGRDIVEVLDPAQLRLNVSDHL